MIGVMSACTLGACLLALAVLSPSVGWAQTPSATDLVPGRNFPMVENRAFVVKVTRLFRV